MAPANTSRSNTNIGAGNLTRDRRQFRDMLRGFNNLAIADQAKPQHEKLSLVKPKSRRGQKDQWANDLLQSAIDVQKATVSLTKARNTTNRPNAKVLLHWQTARAEAAKRGDLIKARARRAGITRQELDFALADAAVRRMNLDDTIIIQDAPQHAMSILRQARGLFTIEGPGGEAGEDDDGDEAMLDVGPESD